MHSRNMRICILPLATNQPCMTPRHTYPYWSKGVLNGVLFIMNKRIGIKSTISLFHNAGLRTSLPPNLPNTDTFPRRRSSTAIELRLTLSSTTTELGTCTEPICTTSSRQRHAYTPAKFNSYKVGIQVPVLAVSADTSCVAALTVPMASP